MKKIICSLIIGLFVVSAFGQLAITKQPDQPSPLTVCEGGILTASVTATGTALLHQWQIQVLKYAIPWQDITFMAIALLKTQPGFENINIAGYNTSVLVITNPTGALDSIQVRCKITQPIPSATVTSTEPYITVYSLPKINKTLSTLKGCESNEIKILIPATNYALADIMNCQYELKKNGNLVSTVINPFNTDSIIQKMTSKIDSTGVYTYKVINLAQPTCTHIDTLNVHVQVVFNQEKIGLVTFDLATNKWKLIWDKTPNMGSDSCKIAAAANQIGAMSYSSGFGICIDTTTSITAPPAPYKIQLIDTCGHLSAFSQAHKPMFLQATVDSVKNSIDFNWTPYTGFAYAKFYIHRSTIRDSIYLKKNIIDSIASTDTSYTVNSPTKNSYYAISVNLPAPLMLKSALKAESGPYTQSLSNISEYQTAPNAINEPAIGGLTISPNPFSSLLQIDFSLDRSSPVTIELINSIGNTVTTSGFGMQNTGSHSVQLAIDETIPEGLYLVKISAGGSTKIIKTIHSK